MWKFFSRGLRETFERRINFSRQDKTGPGQDYNPISAIQNKLIPGIISAHNFDDGKTNLGGRCANGTCNDNKEKNRGHGEKWRRGCLLQHHCKIFEAIGWSGVMVLGWYLCQPAYRCRRTIPTEVDLQKTHRSIQRCHTEYVSLFTLLSRIALAQPLSILPQNVVKSSTVPPVVNVSGDTTDSSHEPEEKPFGPVTAEQALDEAAEGLEVAQKYVLSEIEHRLGMACMQLGNNKEAVVHFEKAVELDYAPAAFNLGLCYETGLGTTQDLKLAVKYYDLASRWGHATAMYNLGVFYVHGWGGVPVDCGRARQLFIAAAELGQVNAKEALDKVSAFSEEEKRTTVPKQDQKTKEPSSVLYSAAVTNPPRLSTPERNVSKKPDPTQTFYELLGIKNSSDTSDEGVDLSYSSDDKDMAQVSKAY